MTIRAIRMRFYPERSLGNMPVKKEKVTPGNVNMKISLNQRIFVFDPELRLDLRAFIMLK
jgi:hypothetical protein